MKKIILSLLLLLSLTAFSASAVDYGKIQVDVTMHPAQYRELLDRFISADTTLTSDELATVYYGFPFTSQYEPRDSFPEVRAAFAKKDYQEVARLVEPALQLNPMSLELMLMGLKAYEEGVGVTPGVKALNLAIRSDQIITTILESGRGTVSLSPFYVICDGDRLSILNNVLGIGTVIGEDTVGDLDAIKFTFPGKSRQHILYFDNTMEKNFRSNHSR